MGEVSLSDTLFDLPTAPEEFGVSLPPANLRRLDFSALDFETMRRACIEYIKTYYADDFNDFVASNGVIMLTELISFIGGILSQRMDILADESFLPTCQTEEAVAQHLALINQSILRQTPATTDVEVSISQPVASEVRIQPGQIFRIKGEDGFPLYYEIYRAPGDWTSYISIPPGKRGVIAFGIEGRTIQSETFTSNGGPDQTIEIVDDNILGDPIKILVGTSSNATEWKEVDIKERYGSNDEIYEVRFLEDRIRIIFGDDVNGKSPLAGQEIKVIYRIGGGSRGRIGTGVINDTKIINPLSPTNAAVEVKFRNITPSIGGVDKETISEAKKRAPRQFATNDNAVTGTDYGLLASKYSHPVFGSVLKAIGTIRTGIDADISTVVKNIRSAATEEDAEQILLDNYVNRNIVELHVLANGPNGPVKPNAGLKRGLVTYFEELNVLTDEVRPMDGAIKAVDVEATIVMSRNAKAGTVKESVQYAITSFFNIENYDMGEGLNISNLYNAIEAVPGVKFVNIFKPVDNILPTGKLASPGSAGVGYNEVITLGNLNLQLYFESNTTR